MKTLIGFCLWASVMQFAVFAEAGPPKNVLLILTDDMSDALGCYGNKVVKSPNIDALAARGVRFNNANANYPSCNGSRSSLLSGVYPESAKTYFNTDNPRTYLGRDWVMLQEHFDNNGYFTARVGKVAHDTVTSEYRWDLEVEVGPATGTLPPVTNLASGGVGTWAWAATNQRDEETTDGRNARYVAQLLEQHQGEPFFIALGFRKPHTPWVVPQTHFNKYSVSAIKLPFELGEPADDRNDIPSHAVFRSADAPLDEWLRLGSDDERRRAILAAYASYSFVDAGVGIILNELTRLNLWENTVVVFASDHGYHFGEHGGLIAKETVFAESTRIPLIIVAPGKSVRSVASAPVELLDLYPTLAELCELPVPAENEGVSLVPYLDNPATAKTSGPAYSIVRKSAFGRSIRTGLYRYTEWSWGDTLTAAELYNLQADPGEFTNQISNSSYATVLTNLKLKLQEAKSRPLPR
jgi:arylsulfatase A-like enzyme